MDFYHLSFTNNIHMMVAGRSTLDTSIRMDNVNKAKKSFCVFLRTKYVN